MAINHKAAKEFTKRWSGKNWSEDQYARTFWMDLLKSVFDIEYNDTNNVIFEYRTNASGKIDLWLRNLSTMVEMKSSGVDLDKPEPRQGVLKTPFRQVYDYAVSFPRNEQPDYLITCNFEKFRVYSRKEYGDNELEDNPLEFSIEEFSNKPEYLGFLIDPKNSRLYHEREISEQAGQLIGKLYDMLRNQYIEPDSDEAKHSLNVLCVRLVFCLFCEDAGLFNELDAFYNFLKDVPAANIRINLQRLFKNLDTPKEKRDKYDEAIKVFPYVNGGLFREEVEIPNFTEEIKDFLLKELSRNVDWSKISPTIFGGIFESTLNPETRRKGGMHYTSPENIHKVIDPLFLDDLKYEFESIRDNDEFSVIQKNNRFKKLHSKICNLTFLDPAAGSGNFLTETYICLRQLEFAIISELKRGKNIGMFDSSAEGEIQERVKLSQFYGIEINDFAVSVAETALWISRLKANAEGVIIYDMDEHDFPLEERANIICENALRFNWTDLIEPSELSYIMGNPPFVGATFCNQIQKQEVVDLLGKVKLSNSVDYVGGWYIKAAQFIANTNIRCALVSTNSITQGEQVAPLWGLLFKKYGIQINFAYRTFVWDSETNDKAHVHCVIIGFGNRDQSIKKYIYNQHGKILADNINAYLMDAPSVCIASRSKPIGSVNPMILGNKPADGGYLILSAEEKDDIIRREPEMKKYIREYIGAVEFINNKMRYCLWLKDASDTELASSCEISKRVNAVREFRLNSTAAPTREKAKTPHLFFFISQPESDYLIIPSASSERRQYVPIGFMNPNVIASNLVSIVPNASMYQFGVLTSATHMAWMKTVGGRLKSDYRYTGSVVYNTFPWPTPTEEQIAQIRITAQAILDARKLYPDRSLADLYDPDKMPEELRLAHDNNDKAVMSAYGFPYDMTETEIVAELMKIYQKFATID